MRRHAIAALIATAAIFGTAAPVGAVDQPDFTIAVDPLPALVPYQGLFTVSFTVTNIGIGSGGFMTTDQFSTAVLPTGDQSPECTVRNVLIRGHRQVAGIDCLHRDLLAPGESVTYYYVLKAKSFNLAGLVQVNANHNALPGEPDYTNNSGRWYLNIDPTTLR